MLKEISIVISAFIVAFLDSYIVGFVPPVSPTIGTLLQTSDHIWITTIISGISVGCGTTLSLWFFRTIGYKFVKIEKFSGLKMWQRRITIFVNNIGYYIIIPFAATSLTMAVAVTFLFSEEVNYKKFLIYMIMGRTLILSLFVALINFGFSGQWIPIVIIFIIYVVAFVWIGITFYKYRHVIAIIREEERKLKDNMTQEEKNKQVNFRKKIMFWKRWKK